LPCPKAYPEGRPYNGQKLFARETRIYGMATQRALAKRTILGNGRARASLAEQGGVVTLRTWGKNLSSQARDEGIGDSPSRALNVDETTAASRRFRDISMVSTETQSLKIKSLIKSIIGYAKRR
jgi:hypothetical protein